MSIAAVGMQTVLLKYKVDEHCSQVRWSNEKQQEFGMRTLQEKGKVMEANATIRAVLWAAALGIMGYFMAHYFPIFSDPLTRNFCEPFSGCRSSAVLGYVVGGAMTGFIFGIVNQLMLSKSSDKI